MKTNRIILVISASLMFITVFGQNEEWEKNQQNIETLIYDVVGSKEIKLSQANRLYDPVPPPPNFKSSRPLEFTFSSIFYGGNAVSPTLRPRPVAAEEETKLYSKYVKLGAGNYGSLFLDAYAGSKRNREYSYSANVFADHSFRGSVDKNNSAEGMMGVGLNGAAYGDKATIYGNLNYSRLNTHFYGYPAGTSVEAKDILQAFNRLNVYGGVKNTTDDGDFEYDASLGLNFQSNASKAKEADFLVNIATTTEVIDHIFVDAGTNLHYINRTDASISGDRFMGGIYAFGRFQKEKMKLYGGMKAEIQPDTLGNDKGVMFFPNAGIDFYLNKQITVSGKFYGGVDYMTWQKLSKMNPFIEDDALVNNEINRMTFETSIKGSIGGSAGLEGGFAYSNKENSTFFINQVIDQSKFEAVIDSGNVTILNPYLAVNVKKDGVFYSSLRGDYFKYNMGNLDEAWHRPTYSVLMRNDYWQNEKLQFTLEAGVLGGIKTLDGLDVKELNTAVVVNLGFEYMISNRFGAFIKLDNLLNNKYQLLTNYPVRGFRALGGVSLRF